MTDSKLRVFEAFVPAWATLHSATDVYEVDTTSWPQTPDYAGYVAFEASRRPKSPVWTPLNSFVVQGEQSDDRVSN